MRRYLSSSRNEKPKGTALAVAMLVIVLLSGIGMVALNAASYDVASAGAVRQGATASSVAQAGMVVGRCEMCEGIDGMIIFMQTQRESRGESPSFEMNETMLELGLAGDQRLFEQPVEGARGSFGFLLQDDIGPPEVEVLVRVDRPRETGSIAGFSMRESVGSNSASFCFRSYRMSSTGTYRAPGVPEGQGVRTEHRAFLTAGPVECSN